MRYNQFSYIPQTPAVAFEELMQLGFPLTNQHSPKQLLKAFLKKVYHHKPDLKTVFSALIADENTDLWTFLETDTELTEERFNVIALQLLGFIPFIDFTDSTAFIKEIKFPVQYNEQHFIMSLYHLLATRTKNGMLLIDELVSQGLLASDNDYHYFNGKSLATFDTNSLIREIVYVELPFDTDQSGENDLVKVNIIRPNTRHTVPTVMTASPYHEGINVQANDKKLYTMEGTLSRKEPETISVETKSLTDYHYQKHTCPQTTDTEEFSYISSYRLNDYFLARGFANIYVSGIGTAGSTGFMTSGDYQQIESFKAVIKWLNGEATAFTSHQKQEQVLATWANGKVATTGKSYLGTMSNGLATTGVKGLEVIIAEAAISSWYDYYRENGLICSPGGYPGEDLDVLTELTYSRNLLAGDYLKNNAKYQELLSEQSAQLDRETGDYNQYWHDRNYLPHAGNVKCEVVFTHGLQDWNVKPRHVYNIFNALPDTVSKHAFLHHGEHVYMHNWQSIDFRESMNALLSQKLLGYDNHYHLPELIWQENDKEQSFTLLESFGSKHYKEFAFGSDVQLIDNHYNSDDFTRYGKDFKQFKAELFDGKAHQIIVDIPISETLTINGEVIISLRLKSSTDKGIISAQVLDYGMKKRFADIPRHITFDTIDHGKNFAREALLELPFVESPYRVISKGVLNLQNREDLLTKQDVTKNNWMTIEFKLQPTIYTLTIGDTIRVLLYTTDFEHTIRDNSHYILTIDLEQSSLKLPH